MNVIGWRAWYVDGSVYASPTDLPADGCLGFVVYYDAWAAPGVRYRDVVNTGDWYVLRADGRVERHGLLAGAWGDPPEVADGDVLIRSAPTLSDDDWEAVRLEMMEADSWP